jgi:hypothetical protein
VKSLQTDDDGRTTDQVKALAHVASRELMKWTISNKCKENSKRSQEWRSCTSDNCTNCLNICNLSWWLLCSFSLPRWKVTILCVLILIICPCWFPCFQPFDMFWLTEILATNEAFSRTHCTYLYWHICAT